MKTKNFFLAVFPLLLTLGLYVVFYSRIQCKPDHFGFWLIIALGMSIGVAITRLVHDLKK